MRRSRAAVFRLLVALAAGVDPRRAGRAVLVWLPFLVLAAASLLWATDRSSVPGKLASTTLLLGTAAMLSATEHPERTFAVLHRAHWVLLGLGLLTVFGAVAGSHGWSIF